MCDHFRRHVSGGHEGGFAAGSDVGFAVEEGDEVAAEFLVARVFHDLFAIARTLERGL